MPCRHQNPISFNEENQMRKLSVAAIAVLFLFGIAAAQGTASGDQSEKPKRGPVFRPTKDQIAQVQKILIDKKLYTGEASGKYDEGTRAGIREFQGQNGLKQTGTLNRATLEKFGVALTDTQKAIPVDPKSYASGSDEKPAKSNSGSGKSDSGDRPKRSAPFRATKEQIQALQKKLIELKLYSGAADGTRTPELKDAVKKFQETSGLKATGGINAETLKKAGVELTEKQKEQLSGSSN